MKAILACLVAPLLCSCSADETVWEDVFAIRHSSAGDQFAGRVSGPFVKGKSGDLNFDPNYPPDDVGFSYYTTDHFDGERLLASTFVNGELFTNETRDWTFLRAGETWTTQIRVSDSIYIELRRWGSADDFKAGETAELLDGIFDSGAHGGEVSGEHDGGTLACETGDRG